MRLTNALPMETDMLCAALVFAAFWGGFLVCAVLKVASRDD